MKDNMKMFWTRTYQKRIGQMIGVCYRYVQDRATAEDLAHDAFLKAIEKADTYKGIGTFDKWLMRITVNTALHYLRDQKMVSLTDRMPEEDNIPDTHEESEELSAEDMMSAIKKADFTMDEILEAIAQLPDNHRIVFNLYVFEQYSHKQIAELQGITINTSKSHLLRARKELQQILFHKSQQKKRLFMVLFPLIPTQESAIDSFCRQMLGGFTLPPLKPLSAEELAAAASNNTPFRLWLRSHATHIGVGAAAAGVAAATAGILLSTSPQENTNTHPQTTNPQSVTVVADSTAVIDDAPLEPQSFEPKPQMTSPQHDAKVASSTHTHQAATTSDSLNTESEAPQPVVVKKIKRTNRTIVIQDPDKQ